MASNWNYRVMEFVGEDGEKYLSVHEVHYKDGVPISYTESPAVLIGNTMDEICECYFRIGRALCEPVLIVQDFVKTSV